MIDEIPIYPVLQDTPNGVSQRFSEDWTWLGITIPAGFITDGTSSPIWARLVVPRRGKYVFAAYIHDYCLSKMSRREAAQIYLKALRVLGAPKYQQFIRYRGVRIYDVFSNLKSKIK